MKNLGLALLAVLLVGSATSEKGVSFETPGNGSVVKSPVKLKFAVHGMKIEPAGELKKGTGHHHVIVNGKPVRKGVVVPADATHIHFGKGETETTLILKPGKHTLTLQFADGAHRSYGKRWAKTIHITVKE